MTEMDRILTNLKNESENLKAAQAENAKIIEEARINEANAKKRIAELEKVTKKAEAAKAAYDELANLYQPNEKSVRLTIEDEENNNEQANKTNKSSVRSFVAGAALVALIGTGAWALSKDNTGARRIATWFNGKNTETTDENNENTKNYAYDYSKNVVTVPAYTYDFETPTSEEIELNNEYVALTTENFETLTNSLIAKYESLGLQVSRENIIEYVMIVNLDKLRQDNNELVSKIIGTQDVTEVFADAFGVADAIRNYNLLYFDKYHTTAGFISATDAIFDDTERARATEIEKRIYEIGAHYQEQGKFNELTYSLLRELYNPLSPIAGIEDGASYVVESIDMYMIRSTFGTNRYITLDETNANLIKYFVTFAGDGEEYENNSLMNGNVRNILNLLIECSQTKTLTK